MYERKIIEVVNEKRKYFSKVLSLNAETTNYQRILDTEDHFNEQSWLYTYPFLNFNIGDIFDFGFGPDELEPFITDFEIELPSVDEWLQGIKIKFKPIDIGDLYKKFNEEWFKQTVPPKFDFDTFVNDNIREPHRRTIVNRKYAKGIYGRSKFGRAYYDPPVIRDILRSTFFEIFKKRPDYERLRTFLKIIEEKYNVNPGILEAIYNRLVLLNQAHLDNMVLHYGILNVSKLSERTENKSKVTMITYRGDVVDVYYRNLAELHAGFILNVTPLGFGHLLPREDIYKEALPKSSAKVFWFIDYKARRLQSRYRATHVAFANYQKVDEMTDFYKSERVDQYHALRSIAYHIDHLVENFLANKDIDVFRLNLYKRAVQMLIGYKKKRHKWGYDAFKTMTEEEFYEFWLDYWEKQGLDRNTLVELYNMVRKWLPSLRSQVKQLGEYLRKKREQLARYLK